MPSPYTGIIISGLPCSGKSTLAQRLSTHYNWPVHSLGGHWRRIWQERYPDGKVSFEEFWRGTSLEDNQRLNDQAKILFERGEVIGDTRYAPPSWNLPALLVFVTADLDTRVRRALQTDKYTGKSPDDVKDILQRRRRDEYAMGCRLFGARYDYNDPQNYDVVLNSARLRVEKEVSLVTNLVGEPSEDHSLYFVGW